MPRTTADAAAAELAPSTRSEPPEPEPHPMAGADDLISDDETEMRQEQDAPKRGLAGLLSRFRLPGFGRRRGDEANARDRDDPDADEPADDDLADLDEDELTDDRPAQDELLVEDETFFEDDIDPEADDDADPDGEAEGEPSSVFDLNLRRLHAAVDMLAANQLLGAAASRTGNRIDLRKVGEGLDLVVKGVPTPLGTVRVSPIDGHAVYQPKFGLDLRDREPNRADLEIWMKAMDEVVVRVLEDIAARRMKRGQDDEAGGSA